MYDFLWVTILALIGSILGLSGGVIFLYHKNWAKGLEQKAIPFAVGTLLATAIIGLLPESVEHIGTPSTLVITTIAFLASWLFEALVIATHHHSDGHHLHDQKSEKQVKQTAQTSLVILGDTVHNAIDGVAIGATYVASPMLGMITAISTLLHEIPHEIADFGILLRAGWKKRNILMVNIVSAITTIIGAWAVLQFDENEQVVGSLLSTSAGIFLYLGTIDLLPEAFHDRDKKERIQNSAIILLGAALIWLGLQIVPHGH